MRGPSGVRSRATGRVARLGHCEGGSLATPQLQAGTRDYAGPGEPELERQPLGVSHVPEPEKT